MWKRKRLGRQASGGNNQDRPGSDVGGEISQIASLQSEPLSVRYAALDDGAKKRLAELEEALDFDTIISFRLIAERQLRNEARAERHARRVAHAAALVGTPSPLLNHQQHSQGRLWGRGYGRTNDGGNSRGGARGWVSWLTGWGGFPWSGVCEGVEARLHDL